jgi:dTDP-glucose 4,6-dehydratase
MNKNIMITGGSGFIGTNLVNYLNKKNYKIFNIDKLSYCSTPENFKIIKKKNYFFYKINISNLKKINFILKKKNIGTIVHLASESHVDRSIDSPFSFIKKNILSTASFYENINTLIKKKIISMPNIIHVSTDEVFGSLKKKDAHEKMSFSPNSPYAASKASTEHIARSFIKTFGMKISVIRLCNNYGPYQFTEKFIPTCILSAIKNIPIPIYGNGQNIREWMHVDDSCKAIELIIKNFKSDVDYNIGSSIKISNINIAKIILKIMKKKIDLSYVSDRPAHDKRYSLNSKKFRKKFNWKPALNIEKGIEDTINWYLLNDKWLKKSYLKYKGQRLGKI